jgi:mannose-6-phosphate isomerase-like protein (cupin superfamily)
VLERCPYIREVLASFHCPLKLVRFLKLSAGSNIKEHSDFDLSFEDGEVRVHIPIQTNPQVEFVVDGERLPMGEGECWYINFNLPHRIHNGGETDRVHLVIDCVLNDWLRGLFPAA